MFGTEPARRPDTAASVPGGDEHMERVQRLARRQLGVMGCLISTVLRGKDVSKIRDHVCLIVSYPTDSLRFSPNT